VDGKGLGSSVGDAEGEGPSFGAEDRDADGSTALGEDAAMAVAIEVEAADGGADL
jgi:hypothetical protein